MRILSDVSLTFFSFLSSFNRWNAFLNGEEHVGEIFNERQPTAMLRLIVVFKAPSLRVGYEARRSGGIRINFYHLGNFNFRQSLHTCALSLFVSLIKPATTAETDPGSLGSGAQRRSHSATADGWGNASTANRLEQHRKKLLS